MPLATVPLDDVCDDGDVVAFEYRDQFDRRCGGFVLRFGGQLYAYQNRCPHRGTPLDADGDRLFDGMELICATHGARFTPDGGRCVAGPCAGDRLRRLGVDIDGDRVVIDRLGPSL